LEINRAVASLLDTVVPAPIETDPAAEPNALLEPK
jgi:hypothetical protein